MLLILRDTKKSEQLKKSICILCVVLAKSLSISIKKKFQGLCWWLGSEESFCQCRRLGFNPWSRRPPGGGYGNRLQCSCLENPMDRGGWQATVHGVTESQT